MLLNNNNDEMYKKYSKEKDIEDFFTCYSEYEDFSPDRGGLVKINFLIHKNILIFWQELNCYI